MLQTKVVELLKVIILVYVNFCHKMTPRRPKTQKYQFQRGFLEIPQQRITLEYKNASDVRIEN